MFLNMQHPTQQQSDFQWWFFYSDSVLKLHFFIIFRDSISLEFNTLL